MSRTARLVVPGIPHHVTQRGNRRGQVFYSNGDHLAYLYWLREYSTRFGIEILAYCLMTNHVHLVVVPPAASSLPLALGPLHTRIAQRVNRSKEWKGHLWQGRYFASALDEPHFWSAIRYVERNPVRAGMLQWAEEYPWSSARAHCGMASDPTLTPKHRWLDEFKGIGNWSAWLAAGDDIGALNSLRKRTRQCLPCGSDAFVEDLAATTGRKLPAMDK